jgi:hypothetical protein
VSYTVEYEVGGIEFEFTPAKGTKGELIAISNDAAVALKVELGNLNARKAFVEYALELHPEAFELTKVEFQIALNDLATHVIDDAKIRAAKAEEDDEDEDEATTPPPEEGTDEYEAAMAILKSDDVLGETAKAMNRLGHVGEWSNKQLGFLCAVSARAGIPVQPSTHAQSSTGKNELWDKITSLMPPSSSTSAPASRRRRSSGPP